MARDPWWWNTVCLFHMDGADSGTTFTDETGINTVVVGGSAVTSTSSPKFGTASGYFPGGNSDRVRIEPDWSQDHNFAMGNFTIECWFKTDNVSRDDMTLMEKDSGAYAAGSWALRMNDAGASVGDIAFYLRDYHATNPMMVSSSSGYDDNSWHHVAVTRNEDRWKLFVDGTVQASATHTGAVTDLMTDGANTYIYIGNSKTASRGWTGYLDDVRITKGYPRYTVNFPVPTAALGDEPDTGSRTGATGATGPDGLNIPGEDGNSVGATFTFVALPPAPPQYDKNDQDQVRRLVEQAFR